MLRKILKQLLALAVLSAALSLAWAQQKVVFPSAEFASKFFMAKKVGKPMEIFAYLSMPSVPVSGKIPVVVIAHGSAGVQVKDTDFWAPYFNRLGFAALVVDSFTPRGVSSVVDDQRLVSNAADTVDAFYALRFLAADPRFDADRIGIIGFSRGGVAANESAIRTFRDNVLHDHRELQFAFHIPVYPGCQNSRFLKEGRFDLTGAPMLFLMGGKDDYTPASLCLDTIKEMQAAYPDTIEYHIYDGANHGFDSDLRVKYHPLAVTTRACPVIEADLGSWSKKIYPSGEPLDAAAEKRLYQQCMTRGTNTGAYDSKYRDMAARDVADFLRRYKFIN
jgi:dienelactone hydrolase